MGSLTDVADRKGFRRNSKPKSLTPPAPSAGQIVHEFLGIARRQYGVLLFVIATMMGVAGIYVLTTPPRFTATATLLIDTRKNQLFQQQSVLSDTPVDSAAVESQVQILRSETIALAVIKQFGLAELPGVSQAPAVPFRHLRQSPPCSSLARLNPSSNGCAAPQKPSRNVFRSGVSD